MKTKISKILICLVIILICCLSNMFFYCSEVSATSGGFDFKTKINELENGEAPADVADPVINLGGTIITVVKVVCAGVAIIMIIVLGIKYMISAPSDRATIMKHAWVYLVGALIMFASSAIISIIEKFAGNI